MKQPKFSIRNAEIESLYKNELTILSGKSYSNTIIGIIGDETESRNGTVLVPLVLFQRRTDTNRGSSNGSIEFGNFTGLGSANIVRHVQNVTKEAFDAQNLKEGMIVTNAHLAVDRQTEPFYDGQEPIKVDDQPMTSEGLPVYRNTRLVFGEAKHLGIDIVFDEVEVMEVETEEASLVLEEEF